MIERMVNEFFCVGRFGLMSSYSLSLLNKINNKNKTLTSALCKITPGSLKVTVLQQAENGFLLRAAKTTNEWVAHPADRRNNDDSSSSL